MVLAGSRPIPTGLLMHSSEEANKLVYKGNKNIKNVQ